MRLIESTLALFLFLCAVSAQGDGGGWPNNNPDDDPTTTTYAPEATATDDPGTTAIPTPTGVNVLSNTTVYEPDTNQILTSPRSETLSNNTIIATWNDPVQSTGLLIYSSKDDGFSWYSQGVANSDTQGRKLLEPHLLYIPGSFSGEDDIVLLAVNAVDSSSTNIELYVSWDHAATFSFVQRIATGGPVGSTAVSQPFLLLHNKRLTVYYSDQSDAKYAQKISQRTATDMWDSWKQAQDIALPTPSTSSVGSAGVVQLPNKQYFIISSSTSNSSGGALYQITTTPESATKGALQNIVTASGKTPQGPVFVTWSSQGGVNGTIVVADSTSRSLFVNEGLGLGPWKEVVTKAGRAYGKEVKADADKRALRILAGAENSAQSVDVVSSIIDFQAALQGAT